MGSLPEENPIDWGVPENPTEPLTLYEFHVTSLSGSIGRCLSNLKNTVSEPTTGVECTPHGKLVET